MKNSVKVAYFDTTKSNPPRIVGEIRGTPTIKFIYPSPKNKKSSNKKKIVLDYNGEREVKALADFATARMPNFVTRLSGLKTLDDFFRTAHKYALPKVLVFSDKSRTSPILKSLSSTFRRRVLIGEVRASKNNADIIKKYNIDKLPAVMAFVDSSDEPILLDKKPSYNRMSTFLHEHSLKRPYFEDEVALAKIAEREKAESKSEL